MMFRFAHLVFRVSGGLFAASLVINFCTPGYSGWKGLAMLVCCISGLVFMLTKIFFRRLGGEGAVHFNQSDEVHHIYETDHKDLDHIQ